MAFWICFYDKDIVKICIKWNRKNAIAPWSLIIRELQRSCFILWPHRTFSSADNSWQQSSSKRENPTLFRATRSRLKFWQSYIITSLSSNVLMGKPRVMILSSLVGRIIALKDVHILIPRSYEYIMLVGKELKLQMELRFLPLLTLKWGHDLGLSRWSECNHRSPSESEKEDTTKVRHREIQHCWLWRPRRRPWEKECGQPLDTDEKAMDSPPESPERNAALLIPWFSPVRFMPDFWPRELLR